MNVDETEKHPFLAAEIEWIRQAVGAAWTLGISLAQLLAKGAGPKSFQIA